MTAQETLYEAEQTVLIMLGFQAGLFIGVLTMVLVMWPVSRGLFYFVGAVSITVVLLLFVTRPAVYRLYDWGECLEHKVIDDGGSYRAVRAARVDGRVDTPRRGDRSRGRPRRATVTRHVPTPERDMGDCRKRHRRYRRSRDRVHLRLSPLPQG